MTPPPDTGVVETPAVVVPGGSGERPVNRYALTFTVKPGSEEAVAETLRHYRRPAAVDTTGGPPLLRRTSVFLAGRRVIRVIDVAGEINAVMQHLTRQPQIRAVEEALDPHLATPRDLHTREGVNEFLRTALLPSVLHRITPSELLPQVPADQRGQRCGLLYPVRPGHGGQAAALLAGSGQLVVQANEQTALASTTIFHRGDVLFRVFEVDGSVSDALDHLARKASQAPTAGRLGQVMDTDADLTTESGFREFLETCRSEMLTDRRVGVPA